MMYRKEKISENGNKIHLEKKFLTISLWFSIAIAIVGVIVLLGWALDIRELKSISPHWLSMKANTALCFLLAGISIALQNPIIRQINPSLKKTLSAIAAGVFGLIAALNLFEYLFKINLGIDELIFKEDANPFGTLYRGRMAPSTVLCFLLLSISILIGKYQIFKTSIFQIPILLTCIISLTGLAGYIFKAQEMFSSGGFNSMAFLAASCFLLLSLASLFSRPRDGLMKLVSSDTMGGKLIRKIWPFAVVLFFLLGWLHLEGEELGVYNSEFGIGILIISFIIIFTGTIYFTAAPLTKFEAELIAKSVTLENSLKEISDYKYALDKSSIVSITDPEGNIKYVNENFVRISKFSREELMGQNHSIVNSGHHPKELFSELWTTISAGRIWRSDIKSKAKDGTYYWADTTIVPFVNKEGMPFQYLAIRNDITKRKEAEEAIKKSEKFLNETQSIGKIGSWEADIINNISNWSENCFVLYGLKPHEIVPSYEYFKSRVHPDDLHLIFEGEETIFKNKQPVNNEIRILLPDGTLKWIQNEMVPILKNDKIIFLKGLNIDITERKNSESAILKSQQDFKNFINNSLLAICFFNPDTQKLIYANPAFLQLLGYLPEEINSIVIYDFMTYPEEAIKATFVKLLKSEHINIGERVWKRKDGSLVNMFINASGGSQDNANIIYVSGQNITEIKKAEAELKAITFKLNESQAIAHFGNWEINLNTKECTWSDESYRILGLDVNETIPSMDLFLSFIHPEDLLFVKEKIASNFTNLKGTTFTCRIIRADGTIAHCLTQSRLDFDETGKPVRLYGTNQDITQQILAEKQKEFDSNNMSSLINNTSDLLWSIDRNYKLITSNSAFDEMVKLLSGKAISKGSDVFTEGFGFAEGQLKRFTGFYERAFSGETFTTIEYLDPPAGVWSEISFYPIRSENVVIGTACYSRDITKSKIAEREILNINEELHQLSSHLQNIREQERTHIAREIHDELGQLLTVMKMDIGWIMHKQNNADSAVVSKLNEMLLFSDGIINAVRRISSDLRPAIINDLGLIAALEWKCRDFEEKMKIPCTFISYIEERKFENNFSINVFRILQETLTNISRHAQAKSVIVSVKENEQELIMQIADDGIGIDADFITKNKTLGILGMKERARLLGGELIIKGEKNKGTQIKLIIPLKNEYTIS